MQRDSIQKTLFVAATLCLVCSVLVSTAAVVLRPAQQENRRNDMQKNILQVAGRYDETRGVASQFRAVESLIVNLDTGAPLSDEDARIEGIDPQVYDARKAAKDPVLSTKIEPAGALPQIARREVFARVYLIRNDDKSLDQIILPIYGKGLWSTLYGFISLSADTTTVRGITFYEHGETPGLGGEVDNLAWKASWNGKVAYEAANLEQPVIQVIKGKADLSRPESAHQVDGLSGATITTNGVSSLVRFWLSPSGYGQFLDHIRRTESAGAAAGAGGSMSEASENGETQAGGSAATE